MRKYEERRKSNQEKPGSHMFGIREVITEMMMKKM